MTGIYSRRYVPLPGTLLGWRGYSIGNGTLNSPYRMDMPYTGRPNWYTFTQMLYLAYGFVGQACHFLRKKPKTLGFGFYAESTDNNPLSTKYNKSYGSNQIMHFSFCVAESSKRDPGGT